VQPDNATAHTIAIVAVHETGCGADRIMAVTGQAKTIDPVRTEMPRASMGFWERPVASPLSLGVSGSVHGSRS